jgi:hypothetical protein
MATDFAGSLGCRRRRFRPAARRLAGGGRAVSTRPGFRHLRRRAQDAAGGTQPHPLQAEEENVFLFHGRPGDVNSRLLRLQHGLLENLQRHRRRERCGGGRFRSTPPAAPAEGARSGPRSGIHACCHVRASTSSIVLAEILRFATRLPPGHSAARPPGGPPPRRRRPGRPPGRLPWEMPACRHAGILAVCPERPPEGMLACWHTGMLAVRPGDLPPSPRPPPGMLACWHTGMLAVHPRSLPPPPRPPPRRCWHTGIRAYGPSARRSPPGPGAPPGGCWHTGMLAVHPGGLPPPPRPSPGMLACWRRDAGILAVRPGGPLPRCPQT